MDEVSYRVKMLVQNAAKLMHSRQESQADLLMTWTRRLG